MTTLFNKFGTTAQIIVTAIVALFVMKETLNVFDAVRYPYMGMALASFIMGIIFLSNRWVAKIASFIIFVFILAIAGGDHDVRQVFVYLPFLFGLVAQPLVALRRNLIDNRSEE
jgi:hypothetical protein